MKLKDLGRRLEGGGKTLLRASLLKLLPKPRPYTGPADPSKIRRILAVRHDARLGNLLLLTPSLKLLKTAFPQARVEVLLSDRYGQALAFNPDVDEILTAKSLAGLRLRGYDLAVDFSPHHAFSLSSAVWTALSGATQRVGFDRGEAASFLNELVPVPERDAHETAHLARLVRHAAPNASLPDDDSLRTRWHFGPGERETGRATWRSWGIDEQSVALFLGARAEKRLEPAWFLDLGARLVRSGRKVVLTGGPAERSLMATLTMPSGIFLAPELPLRAFAAAIANARAVLTADTGPMHLAVALDVPTVQMFGFTEPWRFGYGHLREHAVLHTPGRHPSPEEAFESLTSLLTR
ncbi:MAG: glycosyltransferase family 9 protein [Elusimicrobiota bacterium]